MSPRRTWARLRGSTWRWWAAAAIGGAIVVVAIVAFSSGPSSTLGTRAPQVATTRPPGLPGAATPTAQPSPAAGPVLASGATPSSASVSVSPARPDPYVRDFARQPGVAPLPPQPSPTTAVPLPTEAAGGCDRNYVGTTANVCVPVNIPGTDKCAFIARQGIGQLRVRDGGIDSQGLDPDGDGIACNK